MATGTVKFFDAAKGLGKIVHDGGEPDVLVHAAAVAGAEISSLKEGDRLQFDLFDDPKTGKTYAIDLKKL